ncbi:MAG: bacteriohemerythrin [Opitutales bacterium]|nr:bacteriohemerythrin [Opitutales bacterium]
MLIQWSEKYETGVSEIDNQHKEIISQLNRLHDAIVSGLGKDVILDILEFAGNYASKHFSYEENCMNKYKCPVAKENEEAHRAFIQRFEEIKTQLSGSDVDTKIVLDVYRELRDWIKSHILKVDTNLKSCVGKLS